MACLKSNIGRVYLELSGLRTYFKLFILRFTIYETGFVAQLCHKTAFPFPRTHLCHRLRHRTTQLHEAVEQRRTDVQLHHLTLERPGHHPNGVVQAEGVMSTVGLG